MFFVPTGSKCYFYAGNTSRNHMAYQEVIPNGNQFSSPCPIQIAIKGSTLAMLMLAERSCMDASFREGIFRYIDQMSTRRIHAYSNSCDFQLVPVEALALYISHQNRKGMLRQLKGSVKHEHMVYQQYLPWMVVKVNVIKQSCACIWFLIQNNSQPTSLHFSFVFCRHGLPPCQVYQADNEWSILKMNMHCAGLDGIYGSVSWFIRAYLLAQRTYHRAAKPLSGW